MTDPTDLTPDPTDPAEAQMDLIVAIGPGLLRSGDTIAIGGDMLAAILTLIDPRCPISDEALAHPVIARIADRLRPHLATEPPVHDGVHHYLSTGCLHGEMTLPDGRTGHQYCQGMTGMAGMKRGGRCKFCDALCRCGCHKSVAEQRNSCGQEN